MNDQQLLDEQNASFWAQLCGTNLAQQLGVNDSSRESLKIFDDWFFKFYGYLPKYVPFSRVDKKKTLEIGLGYGSVSQKLMESGAEYHALDISPAPVAFSKHRASLVGVDTIGQKASALEIPYPDNFFDLVVSIGSLHHTGDLPLALRETVRVLKPGGYLSVMVYSSLSYRQLYDSPSSWIKEKLGLVKQVSENADSKARAVYDANSEGDAAPYVAFTSAKQLKSFVPGLENVRICSENLNVGPPFSDFLLKNVKQYTTKKFRHNDELFLLRTRDLLLPLVRFFGLGTDYYLTGLKR